MKRLDSRRVSVAVAMLSCAGGVAAQERDKGEFHLLNPTPRGSMREMSADRPDTTESPYTVDAGHVQVELSFVEYVREEDDADMEEWSVMPSNIKVGVLNNVDVQFVFDPYVRIEADGEDEVDGFGQTTVRVKMNWWGNDAGKTALGVMPFATFPTADHDLRAAEKLEGGIIVPFAMELSERIGLGLMGEIDFVRNEDEDEYETEFLHTVVLGFDLTARWGAYLEYIGVEPFEGGRDYRAYASAGVTYAVSEDVQLDLGGVVGLTDEAEDVRVFMGMTIRI